ncbi:MAG: methyltransferase type 11 [uncultured bacterium]|nr:MAG: methyltransferase type 11 [uncultured bacterium]OGT34471.1 MAG: SAM-dependent methyltransferase [Gammaproteobacteria bacterium RIFCSPHIGHO2_02_FULL_39_13]OGT48526.1 MAG: SAM-dependent methyltransferase [Gammaproteobacteria bacterium RIFCSPHIGHO2_12_FULL_39_24]
MSECIDIITPLHTATKRAYIDRMVDEKVICARKAKEYEFDYWDGEKRYGYGGYRFMPGRWKPVAEKLIERYQLKNDSKILDVGCGKGFLLHEIKLLLPEIEVVGFDISKHALLTAKEEVKSYLSLHLAQDPYDFHSHYFDLVISLNALHNLRLFELEKALAEIERVGKQKYIVVESYRDEQELFNLQCWALTAESFFDRDEWIWLFQHFNYTGDYEFIYFE